MARKRKLHGLQLADGNSNAKRRKTDATSTRINHVSHPVLDLYYENVMSLRDYILARFPNSSRSRKQRLKAVPLWIEQRHEQNIADQTQSTLHDRLVTKVTPSFQISASQLELSKLLDTTIVTFHEFQSSKHDRIAPAKNSFSCIQDVQQLSQKLRSTVKSTSGEQSPSQIEIVEFAVEHLLNKVHRATPFVPHILCNGFSRTPPLQGYCQLWANGLYCTFPNCNAVIFQELPWCSLLKLLGKDGDQVMIDLLLHCSIFNHLNSGKNNLCQISGIQLSEIPLLKQKDPLAKQHVQSIHLPTPIKTHVPVLNKPNNIKIIRNRMFYARVGLNAKGTVRMGLQHIHVFNRYSNYQDHHQVVHVMKYIFPRQFGLHNVFTCRPNRRETIQSQQDYTMREQEIAIALRRRRAKPNSDGSPRVLLPKRLRGHMVKIVGRMLKRHTTCAYIELLRHYCPNKLDQPMIDTHVVTNAQEEISTTSVEKGIVALATPPSKVFAFCRSVLLKLLPTELLDSRDTGTSNLQLLLRLVEEFITSRRRETLSLHLICQGFKTSSISWLVPPRSCCDDRISRSDHSKRIELLQELLYYIFDSILIPLIRSNFYVTESNTHVNRLFYFRHDLWRRLTEPCLSNLRETMFEEIRYSKTSKYASAVNPYGHMRLVPKGATFRPIMNLKRKPAIYENGKMILGGRSVNMMLKPVYSMLKHEKSRQPNRLGSSMFSMDEIYPRLKTFYNHLKESKQDNLPLYFAKVDVANCFDTIPQDTLFKLMKQICSQPAYCPVRHAEISAKRTQAQSGFAIAKKFRDREPARGPQDYQAFDSFISMNNGERRSNTVFVEQSVPSMRDRDRLIKMLSDHLSHNQVKLGKKFFKQKRGIPQGSILSSMLCNFFYGQFEVEYLGFTSSEDCLLLRLLDDFLLITLDKDKACRFLDVTHSGSPEYGITVKPQKSMSNFQYTVNDYTITQCSEGTFPYCGKTINTTTLEIGKDRQRQIIGRIDDSLTIERSKSPGEAFYNQALEAMKRQLHAQYTDASFISRHQTLQTLYQDFVLSALRMHAYNQGLGRWRCPVPALIIRTIEDLIKMTISILNSTSKLKQDVGYECRMAELDVKWLATKAFKHVLQSKQSWYGHVLVWLDEQLDTCLFKNSRATKKLNAIAINPRIDS